MILRSHVLPAVLLLSLAWIARQGSAVNDTPGAASPQAAPTSGVSLAPAAGEVPTSSADTASSSASRPSAQTTANAVPAATPASAPALHALPGFFGEGGRPVLLEDLPASEFREAVAALPEPVRQAALGRLARLQVPRSQLDTLRVSPEGGLYHFCDIHPEHAAGAGLAPPRLPSRTGAESSGASGAVRSGPVAAKVPISNPPALHSRRGSSRVLYLDFNGETVSGTAWNSAYGVSVWNALPFDMDGDRTTFNDTEQAVIRDVWERVSEHFHAFDIDVTTEAPAVFTPQTGRMLITPEIDAAGRRTPAYNYGGIAYLGVFGDFDYATRWSPAWVNSDSMLYFYDPAQTASLIAEVSAHEFGHNLGLSHDGSSRDGTYYYGHGTGPLSWAPIMGASYRKNVTSFSKGEYFGANNTQDDHSNIAGRIPYAPADVGNTFGTAAPLPGGGAVTSGTIQSTGDVDAFRFRVLGGSGTIQIVPFRSETPGTQYDGTHLHVKATLHNESGALIASASNSSDTDVTLNRTLSAGTYYLSVSGDGAGSPFSSSPTGYTAYGSIGSYRITNGFVSPDTFAISSQPQGALVPEGGSHTLAIVAGGQVSGYTWQRDGEAIVGAVRSLYTLRDLTFAKAGNYSCVLSNSGAVIASDNAPVAVYRPAPQILRVLPGMDVNFPQVVAGPVTQLTWFRDGLPLPADSRYTAAGGSLRIEDVTPADYGVYELQGRFQGELFTAGAITLEQRPPLAASLPATLRARQGGAPVVPLEVNSFDATYRYSGLPASYGYSVRSGALTGGGPKPGSYSVTLHITDPVGSEVTLPFTLQVEPLPGSMTGTFAGTIQRHGSFNGNNGAPISLTVRPDGRFTGRLSYQGKNLPFSGRFDGQPDGLGISRVKLPRKFLPPLVLSLDLPPEGGRIDGSLRVENEDSAATVTAWRSPWHARSRPASAYAGRHTLILDASADDAAPLGYSTLVIDTAASGVAKWILAPSDGGSPALKGTTRLGEDGSVPIFAQQRRPASGSFLGHVKLAPPGQSAAGSLDWRRDGQAGPTWPIPYSSGFGPVSLVIRGGRHTPPVRGTLLFGATAAPSPSTPNARLLLEGGGIDAVAQAAQLETLPFVLTAKHAAVFPAGTVGSPKIKLVASKGVFVGTLVIRDPHPSIPGKFIARTVKLSGVMLPNENTGAGFFVLSSLTGGPAATTSGVVLLEAIPAP